MNAVHHNHKNNVAITLIGAALTASYMPARRAGNVDPVIVLRAE